MLQVIHISAGPLDIAGGIREVIRQLTPAQQAVGICPVVVGLCYDQAATGIDRRIDQHWIRPTRYRWFDRWRLYRQATRLIRRASGPIIVHAHELRASGDIALKLQRKLHVPYAVTVHIDPAHTKSSQPGAALTRRNQRKTVAGNADGVINVSEFIKSKTELLSPEQDSPGQVRTTIYPAVTVPDLEPLSSPDEIDRPYVLALGRLVRIKGFDRLIRAWSQTAVKNDWRLVIAGDGPDESDLRQLVRQLGLDDSVHFPGRIEGETKWRWLKFANMVAVTTYTIEEAFCLTALEAIHCSRPIVAFAGGGLQELVTGSVNGLLVPPGDETALAQAIDHLAGDAELHKRFSDACPAISRKFTLEAAAHAHLQFYQAILQRKQSS